MGYTSKNHGRCFLIGENNKITLKKLRGKINKKIGCLTYFDLLGKKFEIQKGFSKKGTSLVKPRLI